MYHALTKVIMRGMRRGEQETKSCNAGEPQLTESARVGQELRAHFMQTS
jgi:hypothetical protein